MEGDDLHESARSTTSPYCKEAEGRHKCTEFDQLNTCVECGAPKHRHTQAQFTGGAGARTHPLSDEDYQRQLRKLQRGDN